MINKLSAFLICLCIALAVGLGVATHRLVEARQTVDKQERQLKELYDAAVCGNSQAHKQAWRTVKMQVYLNGKEVGFGDIDMESISESVSVEQKAIRPKSFGVSLSLKIGYGMGYVDDERREYYSRNYRLMTIK